MPEINIQKISTELQTIHSNMLQAMKLYMDITARRWNALGVLDSIYLGIMDKSAINENLKILELCHNQERRLLKILEPAIPRTYEILNQMTVGKTNKLNNEEKDFLKSMFKSLEFILKKFPVVETRIKKEEEYIASPSEKMFSACYDAWEKEKKCDLEILNMINPAQLDKIEELRKNLPKIIKSNNTKITVIGSVALSGFLLLYGQTNIKNAGLLVLYMTSLFIIVDMLRQYKVVTFNMAMKQKETLLRFKRK